MKRLIITVDSRGVYLRETLAVIHKGETGEVHYHAKPIKPGRLLRFVMFLFKIAARLEGK
jgi:hypothetical protein